jgi:putative transposase
MPELTSLYGPKGCGYHHLMPDYRRAYLPGGTYFFTVVTADRARILCTPRALPILRRAIAATRARWPFDLVAIVDLPDHFHSIWTLPPDDEDFSTRWAFLKKSFTKEWLSAGGIERPISDSKLRNRRRGVWQRRFWEPLIRSEDSYRHHCDYVHYNPVHHGFAACPHAWQPSTFRRSVEQGFYESDWLCTCGDRQVTIPAFADITGVWSAQRTLRR